jgi:hypothetical protein
MFRARPRPEKNARPSAQRGSVGSARVWDERTRALRAAGPAPDRASAPLGPAPDELRALVHGIVSVTLDTRLGELASDRRASLAGELERRLLAVFATTAAPPNAPADLSPPPPSETPSSAAIAEPSGEQAFAPAPAEAAPCPREDPPLPPAARVLMLALEERLARLGGPLAGRADLCRLLTEVALAARAEIAAPADADPESLRTLDVLQRRASKLERALHDARAALAYVSGLEHVDEGLASIYRHVQGLSADDPRREQKAGALAKIFRANLELRGRASQSENSKPT